MHAPVAQLVERIHGKEQCFLHRNAKGSQKRLTDAINERHAPCATLARSFDPSVMSRLGSPSHGEHVDRFGGGAAIPSSPTPMIHPGIFGTHSGRASEQARSPAGRVHRPSVTAGPTSVLPTSSPDHRGRVVARRPRPALLRPSSTTASTSRGRAIHSLHSYRVAYSNFRKFLVVRAGIGVPFGLALFAIDEWTACEPEERHQAHDAQHVLAEAPLVLQLPREALRRLEPVRRPAPAGGARAYSRRRCPPRTAGASSTPR